MVETRSGNESRTALVRGSLRPRRVRISLAIVALASLVHGGCQLPASSSDAPAPEQRQVAHVLENLSAIASAMALADQQRLDAIPQVIGLVRSPSEAMIRASALSQSTGSAPSVDEVRAALRDALSDEVRAGDALRRRGDRIDLRASPSLERGVREAAAHAARVLPEAEARSAEELVQHFFGPP